MINSYFTASITKDEKSGWACLLWEESVSVLGTGKPVHVSCRLDGHNFDVTLMPVGGLHMIPLKADIRKVLGKGEGEAVEVLIKDVI